MSVRTIRRIFTMTLSARKAIMTTMKETDGAGS